MQIIPNILYTFWTGGDMGAVVRSCLDTMRFHLPDHEFRSLTENDLPPHVQNASWSAAMKADYA